MAVTHQRVAYPGARPGPRGYLVIRGRGLSSSTPLSGGCWFRDARLACHNVTAAAADSIT